MDAQGLFARINTKWSLLTNRFWASETAVMMTFSVIVGIGTGLGTVAFVGMIAYFKEIFFGEAASTLGFLGRGSIILLPMLGGLLVGPLIHFVAPEAKGHGVPEVMTAIATTGGRIRPIVVLAKALGSAVTIGSGGSVGREGPIVQIGSALGSSIGQVFKLSERRIINLIASGAAAGIAATFNAPIAGVIFALEVILNDFGIRTFSTIVISAVTASAVSRAVLGDFPAFEVPAYALHSPWELLLYLGLGVVSAAGALMFVKSLYFFEDKFEEWKFPPYLKPAIGGLALGVLGYFLPQLFGTGFETIKLTMTGNLTLTLLAILIFGKILATSLTLGSGASGGVFAPALFIGAVLGGTYGELAHRLFPDMNVTSGAYAMVGMAAVFAGAARAPITGIIILFEMTRDYRIILPLMFATVISTILAQRFESESIYTLKLKRRGIDVYAKKDVNLMHEILVKEAMTPAEKLPTVKPDMLLPALARLFQQTSHHGFMVLDDHKELYGIVTLADLERALEKGKTDQRVRDICTRNVVTVFPEESLDDALRHFGVLDVGRLPVVDSHAPRRLLGVLRRGDIVHAYSRALLDKNRRNHRLARLRLEAAAGAELAEVDLQAHDAAVGKQLKEIPLAHDCVIVSIRRGRRAIVPRGNTQLLAGDRVIAFPGTGGAETLRKILLQVGAQSEKHTA